MVVGLTLSGCAGPLAPSTQMPNGVVSSSLPPGYAEFCGRHPALCQLPEGAGPQPVVSLTPEMEQQLTSVNVRINRSVRPAADVGRTGYWEPADSGDCKTYAVRKMQDLLSAGLPRQALHVAILRTPQEQGHAVLTVDTDRGTYVLDNQSDAVQPWEKLPYTYWSREASPGQWSFPTLDSSGRIASSAKAPS
jgi:predicted transglutaminase-like cysteine proteinase